MTIIFFRSMDTNTINALKDTVVKEIMALRQCRSRAHSATCEVMREYYFSCAHKQVKEIRSIRYNISYVCERIFATALTDWLRAEGSYVDTEEEPCDSSFFYAALAYWGSQEPDQWDREKEAWIEELKTL